MQSILVRQCFLPCHFHRQQSSAQFSYDKDVQIKESLNLAVELKDVSVPDYILLPLFLQVLSQLRDEGGVPNQVTAVDHLCANEPADEVGVDLPSCLLGSLPGSNGPGPHFVLPNSVEVAQLQLLIGSPDDLFCLGAALGFCGLLYLDREGNDLGRGLPSQRDHFFYLSLMGKPSCQKILLVQVDQIDHGLGSQQVVLVEILCFGVCPSGIPDLQLLLLEAVKCLLNDLVLFLQQSVLGPRGLPPNLFHLLLNYFRVLEDELVPDNLDVPHRVHVPLGVGHFLSSESPYHVIQSINLHDVRKELVSQPEPFGGPLHQPRNIDDPKHRGSDFGRSKEGDQFLESGVLHLDKGVVGVNCAERPVFDGDIQPGQHVESATLPDVGHPQEAHPKRCPRTAQPHPLGQVEGGRNHLFAHFNCAEINCLNLCPAVSQIKRLRQAYFIGNHKEV